MKLLSLIAIFIVSIESKSAIGSSQTSKTGNAASVTAAAAQEESARKASSEKSSSEKSSYREAAPHTVSSEKKKSKSFQIENQAKRAKLLIFVVDNQLTFQIQANEGLALSFDAPWSLKLKPGLGTEFKTNHLSRRDFETSLPGFKVETIKNFSKMQFEYDLTAFICLADKSQCFREVLTGTAKIGT